MRLKNAGIIRSGYSFRTSLQDMQEGDTEVIQAQDIGSGYGFDMVRLIEFPGSADHFLQDGDVLISARGWPRAMVYRKTQPDEKAVAASSLFVLRCEKGSLLPDYIAYYLSSPLGVRDYIKRSYGASVRTIAKSDLESLEIPSLSVEQLDTLSHFARAKQQYRLQRMNYDLYLQSLEEAVTTKLFKEQ